MDDVASSSAGSEYDRTRTERRSLMRRMGWLPVTKYRYGPGFFNDRLIIDACRPYDRRQTFPAVARVTPDEAVALALHLKR